MHNHALEFILALADEGYHPSTIRIEHTPYGWRIRVTLDDWAAGGEGGDLPHHKVLIDRDNAPDGVSINERSRFEDQVKPLKHCTEEIAETWIREIAQAGKAPDYARIGATDWITRPIEWLRDPLRTQLKKD